MGNLTQLHQGSLNGLRRQTNECIDNAYRKGYEDGKKEPREVTNVEDKNEYQIGYKVGLEDGNKIADKDLKEIQDTTYDVAYNKGLEDAEMANRYFYDTDKSLLSISEKVRLWKEEKKKAVEEIRVGDEVFITGLKDQETIGVITMLANNNYTVICLINGSEMARVTKNDIKPTGRHFEEISQLLDKLRGEEDEKN